MIKLAFQGIQEDSDASLPYYKRFDDYRFAEHGIVLGLYKSRRGNKWYSISDICHLFRLDVDEKIYLYGYLKNHHKSKRINLSNEQSLLYTQAQHLEDLSFIRNRAKRYGISLKNNEINPIINEL